MSQINFSANELIKKGMSGTPTDQKVGKFVIGTVLVGVVLSVLYYALPYIRPIFENIEAIASSTLKIGIYSLIGVLLFMFFKAQWKNIGYINDSIARHVFKQIITYDPFLIQEKKINSAEHDVEKMMEEKSIIDGKYTELQNKLNKYQQDFESAREIQKQITTQYNIETDVKKKQILKLDIDDCTRNQLSCKTYIDTISPIANDMKFMMEFISEGYQIMKRKIKGAKHELEINKDIFYSASSGAAALERMKKAMVGDIELNDDAEKAQLAVMQRTALLVGQMKVSMEIISDVTRSANLEEGGQLALARKKLEALNLTDGDNTLKLSNDTANFNNVMQLKDIQFDFNNNK